MVRRFAPVLLAAIALGAAACSSSSTSTTSTTRATSTTTSTSMATTTTAPGPAPCTAKSLSVSTPGSQGAAGHIMAPLVFTNTATAPCTIGGFPGVAGTNASGAQIAQAARSGSSKGTVTLAPGASASSLVTGVDVPSGTETTCPTFAGLLVTPPNDTSSVPVALQLPGCAGFSVTAVVPGTSGQ